MIETDGNLFHLRTKNSSYIMRVLDTGTLDHVHYGGRTDSLSGVEHVSESFGMNICTVPYPDEDHPHYFPARILYEYPTEGAGDSREGALHADYGDGLMTLSLVYVSSRIYRGKDFSFPSHALASDDSETLEIELRDSVIDLSVLLRYTVYEEEDVIIRSAAIRNGLDHAVRLGAAASLSLDFPFSDFDLVSFDGAWGRERHEHRRPLLPGITVIDSKLGTSSNEHSPLVYLERRMTGEVYGFNLIYSGSHRETAEVSPFGKTRIITGINPYGFEWHLSPGETFETPEAVLTYSASGIDEAAIAFHKLISRYVIRGVWKDRERPVLINSWEAAYFDFDEKRLLSLAAAAAELGFELFVLDDGWFGSRRDDSRGLGDWHVNRALFPEGLEGFSRRIHEMGMMFGLWVEPEMVNQDSDLFRSHPEWRVAIPGRPAAVSRHQYVLDLSRRDVRDYLYSSLERVFSEGSVDYVKWDMNRTITDCFSSSPECRGAGEFMHRYILGLYDLLSRITARFPSVLFEACASGGNRYDLGILPFMPQVWTSDDTDSLFRLPIQQGTLRGFPPSTMCAHVSAVPGHQSLRMSRIDSRFDVAAFGVLGYELDLTRLDEEDAAAVREEIAFYKKYRKIFQYGTFRPLPSDDDGIVWWSVSSGSVTIVLEAVERTAVNPGRTDRLMVPFLRRDCDYRVWNRVEYIPKTMLGNLYSGYGKTETERFEAIVSGGILTSCGIALPPRFSGNGIFSDTRVMGDNDTRMYVIEEVL